MKWSFLILTIVMALIVWHQRSVRAERANKSEIYYIQDECNGLCFAVLPSPVRAVEVRSIAAVPCSAAEIVWKQR